MSDRAAFAWQEAVLAARLFAIDPLGCGGIRVRARGGPVRDRWLTWLAASLDKTMRVTKLPGHISDERLLGGLDLAATLAAQAPVMQPGLLAVADGGVLIMPMAERCAPHVTAALVSAIDTGTVTTERDGLTRKASARFGLILLDEGADDEEVPPAALLDRVAVTIDLTGISIGDATTPEIARVSASAMPEADDDSIAALCVAADAMGIASVRAPLHAVRIARLVAASEASDRIDSEHLGVAARLVLLPRATRLPPAAEAEPPPPANESEPSDGTNEGDDDTVSQLADRVIEVVRAALPPGILNDLESSNAAPRAPQTGRGSAGQRWSLKRGRPVGVRPGRPGSGARLHVIETLRAAAPWQAIRRTATPASNARVMIRRDDFRIRRFAEKSEALMIFVVDASGSAAMERLGETKGAIELLLAQAYARRTYVALIAFRADRADIVVPPTRSLARARKLLADLAGGGGTPLSLGISAGHTLALSAKAAGRSPFVVLMTDGRANVARDGTPGRARADADALATAKGFGASGVRSVLIDTAARPRGDGAAIAAAMRARYVALPRLDAQLVHAAVAQAQGTG